MVISGNEHYLLGTAPSALVATNRIACLAHSIYGILLYTTPDSGHSAQAGTCICSMVGSSQPPWTSISALRASLLRVYSVQQHPTAIGRMIDDLQGPSLAPWQPSLGKARRHPPVAGITMASQKHSTRDGAALVDAYTLPLAWLSAELLVPVSTRVSMCA